MRVVLLFAIAACGGTRPTEPTRSTPEPVAARPQDEWWCVSFNNDLNGLCLVGRPACQAMLDQLHRSATDPDEKLGECTRTANPICLRKTVGSVEPVCHPSFASCRAHAEQLKNEGITATECRSSDPNAAAAFPRWWCVAYEPATVGSCARSVRACEDSRNFLRSRLPGERINCAAQQSAECFEFEGDSGTRTSLCHPTAAICKSTLASMREDGKRKALTECHPVE